MNEWSPAVEAVAHHVNIDIAQTLNEGIADPTVRDLAASMVRIGYDLGVSTGRLDAALEAAQRTHAKREAAVPAPDTFDKVYGWMRDAAAETVAHCDSCNATHVVLPEPCPEQVALEPVLSETTEPYVSVSTSVTGNDADEVLRVVREAKAGPQTVTFDFTGAEDAFAQALRKAIRKAGAKSFGLKPDDDGLAGVREPRR